MSTIPTGGIKEIIRVIPPKGNHYPFRMQALQKAIHQDPDSPVLPFLMTVVSAQESVFNKLQASALTLEFEAAEPFFVMNEAMLELFHKTATAFCETLITNITLKESSDYSEILKALQSLTIKLQDLEKVQQFFQSIITLDLEALPAHQRLFLLAAMQVTLHFAATNLEIDKNYQLQENDLCPCCKMPAVSAILDNSEDGLRYLYCSFCETKWHVVRSTCTECQSNKSLFQTKIEAIESPMSAEVCDECHTYLKFHDRTKTLISDPFIEDLITFPLAIKLADRNYQTFGLNPYFV